MFFYATKFLTILCSNSCYAGLLYQVDNEHGRVAVAASQTNGKQLPSSWLLSRDQLLVANELQSNKSRDQLLLANERRPWMTLKSIASGGSTRRRVKRKMLRFESEPQIKWPLPIKFKIDDNMSGNQLLSKCQNVCVAIF